MDYLRRQLEALGVVAVAQQRLLEPQAHLDRAILVVMAVATLVVEEVALVHLGRMVILHPQMAVMELHHLFQEHLLTTQGEVVVAVRRQVQAG